MGKTTARYLYVCFVDLRKAFDMVWQGGLFHKLLENGIGGKPFDIITNMYSKSKACVKLSNGTTEYFETNIGVKQGCVISPSLFNLFLNDIPEIFDEELSDPVRLYEKVLNCLIMLIILHLYLPLPKAYNSVWTNQIATVRSGGLQINAKKTKVVIFNRAGCMLKNKYFHIDTEEIEITKETKHLGIIFNNNCTFHSAIENLKNKGMKAMFKLFKYFGNMTPNIETSPHLFDAMAT